MCLEIKWIYLTVDDLFVPPEIRDDLFTSSVPLISTEEVKSYRQHSSLPRAGSVSPPPRRSRVQFDTNSKVYYIDRANSSSDDDE